MLQPEYYPHIFDAIASFSETSTLLGLRTTSKAAAESADRLIFEDSLIVLDWQGRVFLQSKGGPRIHDDLRDPSAYTQARLGGILPRIRHLFIAGGFEFGCLPSHGIVSALVQRMYALEHVTVVPDPYGRRWPGHGSLSLDFDLDSSPHGCDVRCIPRPPTPPISAPYSKEEADTSDLIIRTHSGSHFDPAVLGILGRAVDVTLVLSLWSPGWTTSPSHRTAKVSAPDHTGLVRWRYAAACAFAAGAMEPRLVKNTKSVSLGHPDLRAKARDQGKVYHSCHLSASFESTLDLGMKTPLERNITIVGLEQVHPAYLDHEWMPDYETLTFFREGVRRSLDSLWDADDPVSQDNTEDPGYIHEPFNSYTTHDTADRGRSRCRAPPTPTLDDVYEEPTAKIHAWSASLIDPEVFAGALDRLRDYDSSRSPSPASSPERGRWSQTAITPASRSASTSHRPRFSSRSRSIASASRSANRDASVIPSRPPSRSPSSHSSLYSRIGFVTQLQYSGFSALPGGTKGAKDFMCNAHGLVCKAHAV